MKKFNLGIHQPNFFPWPGFFHKIANVELFYLMDHVQVTMGKGWHSRVKILSEGKSKWLSIPVLKKGRSGQTYKDIEINYIKNFSEKQLRQIHFTYKKHAYFNEIMPLIEKIYQKKHQNLVNFNIEFILLVCQYLNINTKFLRTSDLLIKHPELINLRGNTLVLSLAKISGANSYLSGTGCRDFIEPNSFKKYNIDFYFQDFKQFPYSQKGVDNFIPGLSIIDVLMNLGWSNTSAWIHKK